MVNQEHLDRLKRRIDFWNAWRQAHPDIRPGLSDANLSRADLSRANLMAANLSRTNLSRANLNSSNLLTANLSRANVMGADLSGSNLRNAYLSGTFLRGTYLQGADLREADLTRADLSSSNLRGANLTRADLTKTNLKGADLSDANLNRTILVETNLTDATLNRCHVYGTSVWNVKLDGTKQHSLIITPEKEAIITVDTLEVAQFVYLLLNNVKIRDVINTLTTKAVLILGRFTPERKVILDALKEALRTQEYLPILFDFDKPSSRDITETVSTLAHLARFVIADITDAKSIPQELLLIVPNLPSVPVQPLILTSQHEYGMFEHFTRFPWVLPVYRYTDQESLLKSLKESIIDPAEEKAKVLAKQ